MNRVARLVWLVLVLLMAGPAVAQPAYELEEIALPRGMSPEISAVAFSPSGKLVVANRHGDVWFKDLQTGQWRRFAHGLHEPLGLDVESDSVVYVSHKPELTVLRDTSGDGVADTYQSLADGWAHTDNWHEHAFGLRRDAEGRFIMALGLADTAGSINTLFPRVPLDFGRIVAEKKLSLGPWQGWLLKISPGGEIEPWAYGLREPCGVGLSPEGEIFITDQQGDYIGSSALVHVRKGGFYGHPASAKWAAAFRGRSDVTLEELAGLREAESVILPHGSMGGSPGEPVWDTTGGKFGPYGGQVFVGDFTRLISRVDMEVVHGTYQGACFTFLRDAVTAEAIAASSGGSNLTVPAGRDGKLYFRNADPLPGTPLRQGNMRMAFAPDGSLYVGQTTRGWGAGDGLQRVVWSGRTPVEIHTMRLTERGFRLTFTTPMNRAAAGEASRYRMSRFRYVYHEHYGSPRTDPAEVAVEQAIVSDDGLQVELVLGELAPGFIHALEIDDVPAQDGRSIGNAHAYYTLNRLLSGERFAGSITPSTARQTAGEPSKPRPADARAGQRVYNTFCIHCHQADGKGGGVPGVNAANFNDPAGVLSKSDEDLIRSIAQGIEGKAMPPFGFVIDAQQIADVMAYIRSAFDPAAPVKSPSPSGKK